MTDEINPVRGKASNGVKKENVPEHVIKEVLKEKPKPPRKMGHALPDKRPHFKSFKSPGVK